MVWVSLQGMMGGLILLATMMVAVPQLSLSLKWSLSAERLRFCLKKPRYLLFIMLATNVCSLFCILKRCPNHGIFQVFHFPSYYGRWMTQQGRGLRVEGIQFQNLSVASLPVACQPPSNLKMCLSGEGLTLENRQHISKF